jgi:hypothetical protein
MLADEIYRHNLLKSIQKDIERVQVFDCIVIELNNEQLGNGDAEVVTPTVRW